MSTAPGEPQRSLCEVRRPVAEPPVAEGGSRLVDRPVGRQIEDGERPEWVAELTACR
jgi:hypothetical protein